ncbi:uncharacterized protein [Palaemon carinicauda]|uniref:uncharacterized protein n=1 Tax=Palaemon carinicauda TaxID=392227 RepID=UPI0035B5E493
MLFSDALDSGWGASIGDQFVSGTGTAQELEESINLRELQAMQFALCHFNHLCFSRVVAVFADNLTAISYIRKEGGPRSQKLDSLAQEILAWAEGKRVTLLPQFIMGKGNVTADALSQRDQIVNSEWTIHQQTVDDLVHLWPATVDMFATARNHRLQAYFSPHIDPGSVRTDTMLQDWRHLLGNAFSPFPLIRNILYKLRESTGCSLTLVTPFWPQKDWFVDLLELSVDTPRRLPIRQDLLKQPHRHVFHLRPQALQLTAWRLSADLPGLEESMGRWPNKLPSLEVLPLI